MPGDRAGLRDVVAEVSASDSEMDDAARWLDSALRGAAVAGILVAAGLLVLRWWL